MVAINSPASKIANFFWLRPLLMAEVKMTVPVFSMQRIFSRGMGLRFMH